MRVDASRPVSAGCVLDHPLAHEQARALLKALADPLRLRVIESLGRGERCVCELTDELGLAQSKLSFHLKVLKDAGLLEAREEGRWIYYRLRAEAIGALQRWLGDLAAGCDTPASPCG
jgi:ArsR family transcriptional regulator